jgi:hypothetical protein
MKNKIFLLLWCFPILLAGQVKNLLYLQGKNDVLIQTNGKEFMVIQEGYALVNSGLGGFEAVNGFYQDVVYPFSGFPILVRNRRNNNFALINKEGETVAFFPNNTKGVDRLSEGIYLTSRIDKQKYFDETRYAYFYRDGKPIFSPAGYTKATRFSEGYAVVRMDNKGWRFINDLGHEFDWIPDSLQRAERISALFQNKVLVTLVDYNKKSGSSEKHYLLDVVEKKVTDIGAMFPAKKLLSARYTTNGVVVVEADMANKTPYEGRYVSFFEARTNKMLKCENVFDYDIARSGYVMVQQAAKKDSRKYVLCDFDGKQKPLPDHLVHVQSIGQDHFILTQKLDGKSKTLIYNAAIADTLTGKNEYACIAVLEGAKLFKGVNGEYVLEELATQKELYRSKSQHLRVVNLDKYNGRLSDITAFHCTKDEWVPKIAEMTHLKELTLKGLKTDSFPAIVNKFELQTLRIDECRKLKNIDEGLIYLNQLSLRSCLSLKGVSQLVQKQSWMHKLYIVNMDLTANEQRAILNKVKTAVISGSARSADYELQEEIDGF